MLMSYTQESFPSEQLSDWAYLKEPWFLENKTLQSSCQKIVSLTFFTLIFRLCSFFQFYLMVAWQIHTHCQYVKNKTLEI